MRALVVALVLLGACASSDPEPRTVAPTPRASASDEAPGGAQRYETLEEIADAIGCTGLQDVGTGGNPGLRHFGVCLLGRHNIDIYMVTDHRWDHLAQQFDAVLGPGWIVVCPTGPKAARLVHEAIGGTLAGPSA